jgi:hypothetical protein
MATPIPEQNTRSWADFLFRRGTLQKLDTLPDGSCAICKENYAPTIADPTPPAPSLFRTVLGYIEDAAALARSTYTSFQFETTPETTAIPEDTSEAVKLSCGHDFCLQYLRLALRAQGLSPLLEEGDGHWRRLRRHRE